MSLENEAECARWAFRITAEQLARQLEMISRGAGQPAEERLQILEARLWIHQARLRQLASEG
jgi:hypothetical protein